MKKQLISAVTGIVCMISAMPCSVSAVEDVNLSGYAREVWELVNDERAKEGLEPLVFSAKLNEVADVRAEELLELYSHTRPDGTSCGMALDEKNITYNQRGENIIRFKNMGSDISGIAMDGWMHSDGHRANILKEEYKNIGVGVSYQDGYYYLVQVFCGDFVQWDLSNGILNIYGGSGVMPSYSPQYRPWHNETENIREINLADNITEVGRWAFSGCSNIKEVVIPESVNMLCSYAFKGCDSLEKVTFLNPECVIDENPPAIPRYIEICGYDGSKAQEYAEKYGCTFGSMGEVPPKPQEVMGDTNDDGKFNVADLVMVRNWLFGSDDLTKWQNADLNQDSVIDVFDFTVMKNMLINQ